MRFAKLFASPAALPMISSFPDKFPRVTLRHGEDHQDLALAVTRPAGA